MHSSRVYCKKVKFEIKVCHMSRCTCRSIFCQIDHFFLPSLNISYFSFNQTLHRNFNHPFFARPIQPRQPSLALHNPSSLATSSLKCEVIRRQLLLLLESSYRPPQSLLALSITNVISAVTSRFYLKLSTPGPGLDHAHVHSFHVIFLLKFKTL